jgi:predicted RNA-binding Zn-ribbon protein involved in translation (DUF1610 family)
MRNTSLEIARSVADAGAQYAEERWMQGEADAVRELWRARINDAIFAGVIHAIDLHEKGRRMRRKSMLLWCLKCRAQLRVPRDRTAVRCPTCGNVQPGRDRY